MAVLSQADWPLAARLLAKLANDSDKGLGDVIERQLRFSKQYKKVVIQLLGYDCGCGRRQRELNKKYPLK